MTAAALQSLASAARDLDDTVVTALQGELPNSPTADEQP